MFNRCRESTSGLSRTDWGLASTLISRMNRLTVQHNGTVSFILDDRLLDFIHPPSGDLQARFRGVLRTFAAPPSETRFGSVANCQDLYLFLRQNETVRFASEKLN
jgi:hypothetical protein